MGMGMGTSVISDQVKTLKTMMLVRFYVLVGGNEGHYLHLCVLRASHALLHSYIVKMALVIRHARWHTSFRPVHNYITTVSQEIA